MERRRSQRIPYAVPIRIQVDDLDRFAEQYSADLSTGGVFIRTCRPYTSGAEIKLEFYFPEQRRTVPMRGTVIRSVPDTSNAGGPPGIAIRFRDLNQVALKFLELAIERYNVRHPTEVLELPADFFEYSEPVGVCNAERRTDAIALGSASPVEYSGTTTEYLEKLDDRDLSMMLDEPTRYPAPVRARARRLLKLRGMSH